MELFINMTNPVAVSSGHMNDEIRIQIKNKYLFQSQTFNHTIRENYVLREDLPSLIETKDINLMVSIGEYSKNSMLFTLIIPLAFLVFMSASMNSVWSLYLML